MTLIQSSQTSLSIPMKDGVSASKLYLPKLDNGYIADYLLIDYLCQKFQHIDRAQWQARFIDGQIFDESGNVLAADTIYQENSSIYYYRAVANETHVPFYHEVIFENDDLLIVDKPHFLTVAPAGQYVKETLLSRLKNEYNNAELTPIHRLDRDTAGLILFSKNKKSRDVYQSLFRNQKIHKVYHAIAPSVHDICFPLAVSLYMERGEPFYTMKVNGELTRQNQANTHTVIEVIQANQQWVKYKLMPTTGKLHQLRVHMNYLNIPIKDDSYYPTVKHRQEDEFDKPLQLLAKSVSFIDPITQVICHFTSKKELYLPDEERD